MSKQHIECEDCGAILKKNSSKSSMNKSTIHRTTITVFFAYTNRYLPEIQPNGLLSLAKIVVTVEGPLNEQNVVISAEEVIAILNKLFVQPWAFSILVYKKQSFIPESVNPDSSAKIIKLNFKPSVEGLADFIFHKIKPIIEIGCAKLVSVDVVGDFNNTIIGSSLAK
jgi:hypothetical protein